MNYFDGFVIPVPTADRDIYIAHEAHWWPSFKALGALTLVVGWGDDVPPGKHTDFLRAVDLKPDETVVLCWMTWPDKATRDAAYAQLEPQPGSGEAMNMPFDGKRMIFGGFVPLLDES